VGKVTAQLKTDKYSGPVEKSIAVSTNDPSNARVTLKLRAHVVGSATILPAPTVIFPTPSTGDYSGRLLVRKDPSESGELNLTDVRATAPWLVVKPRKIEQAEPPDGDFPAAVPGDWVLDLNVTEDAPLGRSGVQVAFATGLEREPELTAYVRLDVSRAMVVKPESLGMRVAPGAAEAQGVIQVRVRPGLGKQQLETTIVPGPFEVKVERAAERRFEVTVAWKGAGADTPRTGELALSIGGESVKVPLAVRDRRVPAAPAR
jgi:hypothetical protein